MSSIFTALYPTANVHSPYTSSSNQINVTSGIFLCSVPIPSSGQPTPDTAGINGLIVPYRAQDKTLQPNDDSALVQFQGRPLPVAQSGIFRAYSFTMDFGLPPLNRAPLYDKGVDGSTPAAVCIEKMLLAQKGFSGAVPGRRSGSSLTGLGSRGQVYYTCLQIQDEENSSSSRMFFGWLYAATVPYLAGDDSGWKRFRGTFTEVGIN